VPDSAEKKQFGAELIPSDIPDEGLNLEALLENAEKALLQKALDKSGGVKTEAAKLLGLSFRSFRHRLQKYVSS
jgi:two-component system response regulator PilR (NtrC family)